MGQFQEITDLPTALFLLAFFVFALCFAAAVLGDWIGTSGEIPWLKN